MTSKDLVIRPEQPVVMDRALALQGMETQFAMAVRQRELLEIYIKQHLKVDKHFYKVGDDDENRKPSLTKEGAELVCLPHNLKPAYEILSGPDNPPMDDTPYQITVRCELRRNDAFEGQGIGSANSMVTKKDGTRVQRQRDPGLRHNATLKMAQKSAYIAATLNATAASEFFTQDMEDDQTGHEKPPETKEHWCEKHKTKWFKAGKMRNYAHPIGDTGEWCAEPKEPEKQSSATARPEVVAQAGPPSQSQGPETTVSPSPNSTDPKPPAPAPGTKTKTAVMPKQDSATAFWGWARANGYTPENIEKALGQPIEEALKEGWTFPQIRRFCELLMDGRLPEDARKLALDGK